MTLSLPVVVVPAAAAGPPPPGPATVPGYEVVTKKSTIDSTATRTVTSSCPSGKVLLGGGAALSGFYPTVTITGVRPVPTASGHGIMATAEEWVGTHAGSWWIEATAICANQPSKYQWVSTTMSGTSANEVLKVACPDGTTSTAALGYVTGARGRFGLWLLDANVDFPGRGGQTDHYDAVAAVRTVLTASDTPTWQAGVTAICADLPVQYRTAYSSEEGPSNFRSVTAACMASERLLSGGFHISPQAQWPPVPLNGFVAVSATMPYTTPSPPYHAVAAVENPGSWEHDWAVRSQAICAPK